MSWRRAAVPSIWLTYLGVGTFGIARDAGRWIRRRGRVFSCVFTDTNTSFADLSS